MKEEKTRSFLAIPFGSFYERELSGIVNDLRSRDIYAKWVRAGDVHLTLHFFGYLTEEKITSIIKALSRPLEELKSFQVFLKRIGGFPNLRRPRVLWVGFGGEVTRLEHLKSVTDSALRSIKIPLEDRPFKAHLTLARLKAGLPDDGQKLLSDIVDFNCDRPFKVEEVVLFKSVLTPKGPIYSRLHTYKLHGK